MNLEDGDEHWCPPMANSVKVNSDAAILKIQTATALLMLFVTTKETWLK